MSNRTEVVEQTGMGGSELLVREHARVEPVRDQECE
jgi:hypothetical protein